MAVSNPAGYPVGVAAPRAGTSVATGGAAVAVLHACLEEQGVVVWAEDDPAAWRRALARGRPPRHPGALPAAAVRAQLPAAAAGAETIDAVLWLPSDDRAPWPSCPPGGEGPSPPAALSLSPWRVEGAALSPAAALPLALRCQARAVLADGVRVGAGLVWLGAVARVAAAVVLRQALVPDLAQTEAGTWRARWRVLWSDEERAALAALARTMPGSLRALGDADRPPEASPDVLTRAVAADLAEAIVRLRAPTPGAAPAGTRADDAPERLWLTALVRADGDGELRAPKAAARALAERVQSWQRPLMVTAGAAVRVRLRLEEPARDGEPWRLVYLLHPVDDPSLLIPASELWRRDAGRRGRLVDRLAHGREVLLATLMRLAPLSPPIERSLAGGRPSEARLDDAEAHAFLTAGAAVLAQSGVAVLLPAWWTNPGARLKVTAQARPRATATTAGSAGLGAETLVDVDFALALGDEPLAPDELEALARIKAPLVRLRGQWVEVDPARVAALLALRRERRGRPWTVGEVARLAVGIERLAGGVEVDEVAGEGALAAMLAGLRTPKALAPLPVPAAFRGELRPYQARGYTWLGFLTDLGLGALLADDMGLGKTVQTLCLLARLYERAPGAAFLLCCPASLLGNWRREAERFTPQLPVRVHHGGERERSADFASSGGGGLVLTSYGVLARDRELLADVEWEAVILDEAQVVKNHATQAARAARALRSRRRIALTGTPVQNHVGDLWSIMEVLQPGALGSERTFREQFLLPIQGDPHGPAAERLRRRTGPFILRRLKSDREIIADLPDKLEMKVVCTITAEQASLYQAVLDRLTAALAGLEPGIERQGLVLSTLTRLKQLCDHPALFLGDGSPLAGRSGKLERLEAMLGEVLEGGERALVFTQFAAMAELLARRLETVFGQEALVLTGKTTPRERDRLVARFQDAAGPPLLVLTLGAGGTGLNLTRANHVFHFDRWWNPAVENQATDRAFRIGQPRTVEVHKFVCAGTLEERIDALLERKRAVADEVVGSGEGWLATLDSEALYDVLRLDAAEAIGA